MKIAVIADSHIHPFSNFGKGVGSENSRVRVSLDALDQVLTFCLANKITHLVHLGDVFHARDLQRYQIFNVVYDKFKEFRDKGLEVHIVVGNHDMADVKGTLTIHALGEVVTRIWSTEIGYDAGLETYFMAYTKEYDHLIEHCIPSIPNEAIIFGHLDIVGAHVGSAMYVQENGLPWKLFERFKQVLLGHYHLRQPLGKNGYYVGALTPVDFGEAYQTGGFCTIDTKTAEVEFFDIKCPRFMKFDPAEGVKNVAGSYVRMLCKPDPEWEKWLGDNGAVAWDWHPSVEQEEDKSRIPEISSMRQSQVVQKYVEMNTPRGMDAGRLVRIGTSLLEDAQEV